MMRLILAITAIAFWTIPSATAQSIDDITDGLNRQDGMLTLYTDDAQGRVLVELTRQDGHLGRMIYTARLTSGLGSNPIGLDRGRGSDSYILRFSQVGDGVFAEFENTSYVALGAGTDEGNATAQSFARSIVWQTDILAQSDERVLIDLSGFLKRDPVDAIGAISGSGQGNFSINADRSAPLANTALAFPENIEIDALLTLTGSNPGTEIQATAPAPNAITLTVHHSFIALPDDGYQIRPSDERSGAFETTVYDMATPLDQPLRRGFAMRHRLERVDPTAETGPVVEPIVYYVDRGAPEVIQQALIEGGNWWAEAFQAAGFEDAFRVELLPEGVHPLDSRYNVIQWVHRQTRGWSYGASVSDPRTGEILKGHVILGSQRVRQDRMIFEGLLGRAQTGTGRSDDPLEMALARVRQLSAHEIGHTLGLMHNFAASTNDRASVMDYPAPLVRFDAVTGFDVSDAYDVGIGEWDIQAIRWLYSQFPQGTDERSALETILAETTDQGLLYISDRHARGTASAHPLANLWDNGSDPVQALEEAMAVRAAALSRFGPEVMADGLALSAIRDGFPPIYLYHRYQVEAAAKSLGGVLFAYEANSANAQGVTDFEPARQRAALAALVASVEPGVLDIPDEVTQILAPSPFYDYGAISQRERFETDQYPAFSRSNAAAAAARITLSAALSPARLARMDEQNHRNANALSVDEALSAFEDTLFTQSRNEAPRLTPLREAAQREYVSQLLRVSRSETPSASALARHQLTELSRQLGSRRAVGRPAHNLALQTQIDRGLLAIDEGRAPVLVNTDIPPGSPIGASCYHCDSAQLLDLP